MKLSKRNKEPHTAEALYEYYSNYERNLESYACTHTALEEYKEAIPTGCEFCVWAQRQRALGDKNKEYVRRLIDVGRKRGADLSFVPAEADQVPQEEFLWLTANYTLKHWARVKQAYHFSAPMIMALKNTSKNGFMANVFQTLPYRSFYLDLNNADEFVKDDKGTPTNVRIKGCFVHIDKIDAHDNFVDTWIIYQVFLSEGYGIFAMKNVYYSDEKAVPADGMQPISEDNEASPNDTSSLVVNLITYIAASNADIVRKTSVSRPYGGKGQPKKKPVTNWDVGFRIGPAIEKAFSEGDDSSNSTGAAGGSHSSPRPHIRAAHWHHYWTGPKENRELSLRWVSQVFVNCVDSENLPVVEHQTRK